MLLLLIRWAGISTVTFGGSCSFFALAPALALALADSPVFAPALGPYNPKPIAVAAPALAVVSAPDPEPPPPPLQIRFHKAGLGFRE